MKTSILSAFAALTAANLMAYEANLNLDWRFAKGGGNLYGLDAALATNAVNGVQVYDPAFDDAGWELVSTPHCVNAHDSYDERAIDAGERNLYRGWMFYRKTIRVPEGKHFLLSFDTVRQSLYVYVNGRMAGYYEAGTAPTGYDITPYVKPGETAQITVVTENTAGRGTKCVSAEMKDKPGDWAGTSWQWCGTDFNPVQGGLIGNVTLHVKENDAYITLPFLNCLKTTGVYLWADDFDFAAGSATVHCEAQIFDGSTLRDAKGEELAFEIDDKTYRGGAAKVSGLTFWSPDTPHLYDVKVSLLGGAHGVSALPSPEDPGVVGRSLRDRRVLDTVTIRTGFRKVAFVKGKNLLFNGKEVWLPGYAQRATDSWAAIGFAPAWLQDFDADLIRQSGARFVRWMHITPKPAPIRAFDKYGVVSVCPAGDKEGESGGRQWEQRVEAMAAAIVYFRNSPSIVFWEAGNNQISGPHMKEMRLLKEKYDPHGYRFIGSRTISKPEQLAEAEYVGTMLHRHEGPALEAMKKLGKYLPMVETEYAREESARRLWDRFTPPDYNFNCQRLASGAKMDNYNCYDMTQEDYALANTSGYAGFWGNRSAGRLGGTYVATAMLCWTDSNQHGRQANTENCRSSGRVDAVRIPKENFYVNQVFYSQVPKLKILGHWNYPKLTKDNYWYQEKVNDGKVISYTGERKQRDPTHKTVYVMGSLSVDHVKLFVNGKEVGACANPKDLFTFEFPNVDVTESGKAEAVGYDKDGKEICRDTVVTAGPAAKFEMTATTGPKGFLADGSDIAMVDLRLVDANGVVLPLADNKVTFTLTGPATFMGGWNSGAWTTGDGKVGPNGPTAIGQDWVKLECGLARVFVKAGRTPGKVTLKATLAGSGDAFVPAFRGEAEVTLDTKSVTVTDGLAAEPPQAQPINVANYTVANPVAPVRDLGLSSGAVEYRVLVNGAEVPFSKKSGGAFKPDESTGVVCPYNTVLEALKAAGAPIEIAYKSNKIFNKKLRKASASPFVANLQVKVTGGKVKTIDAIAGTTVIFENSDLDRKNLTNYEMVRKDNALVGELGPLLGYIPGLSVQTDDAKRVVSITVQRR